MLRGRKRVSANLSRYTKHSLLFTERCFYFRNRVRSIFPHLRLNQNIIHISSVCSSKFAHRCICIPSHYAILVCPTTKLKLRTTVKVETALEGQSSTVSLYKTILLVHVYIIILCIISPVTLNSFSVIVSLSAGRWQGRYIAPYELVRPGHRSSIRHSKDCVRSSGTFVVSLHLNCNLCF